LLRRILRLHRAQLPPPMRGMGDTYVLSEFRRHLRGNTTEQQWATFATEWRRYAAMLGGTADQQPASAGAGGGAGVASVTAAIAGGSRDMTEQLLEQLSPDQRRRLAQLQQEAAALGAEMLGKPRGGGGSGGGGAGSEGG
jgi:hypothetical protein